jgi:hypothetical protein
MRDANDYVVLYALALTVLGSLLVWALPLGALRLGECLRRKPAAPKLPPTGGVPGGDAAPASTDLPRIAA